MTDLHLPVLDGLDFLRAVRDAYGDVPIVRYVGWEHGTAAGDALDAGAADCVRKGTGTARYELPAHRIRDAVTSHRTERRLRAEQSQYRRFFEDAPVM